MGKKESKNILGIDWGEKHLGIAISMENSMPLGLKTINQGKREAIQDIIEIVSSNNIDTIIVGYPFSKVHQNSLNKGLAKFIKELKSSFQEIKIDTYDERMTTKLARRYVEKEKEHQEAARIILDDWMKRKFKKFES